jgi:hypothetical protein
MDKKIIGVFHTEDQAIRAIESLKDQGYRSDEISIIAKNKDDVRDIEDATDTKMEEGLATGAATGGILGGVAGLIAGLGALAIPGVGPIIAAGPLAATLGGAAIGAGTGGLVGALIGMGIPEEHAHEYENYINAGEILVMVDADADRATGVYDTFRANNTLNANLYNAPYYTGGTMATSDMSIGRANVDSTIDTNPSGYGTGSTYVDRTNDTTIGHTTANAADHVFGEGKRSLEDRIVDQTGVKRADNEDVKDARKRNNMGGDTLL